MPLTSVPPAQPLPRPRRGDRRLRLEPRLVAPLLEAKLSPPAPVAFAVERPRLLDRLAVAARSPFTVVVGPVGSGKSQLLSSWLRSRHAPSRVAWLSIDEGDDEPGALWPYLLVALERSGALVGHRTVEEPGDVDRSTLVRLSADLAVADEPVVLVLDGVESLAEPGLLDELEFVVRHADGRLRVILSGRTEPALPLHRYLLDGSLTVLRGGDLAFRHDEATSLLTAHGVALPAVEVAQLMRRTEGWAAGLRLFAAFLEASRGADGADGLAGVGVDEVGIGDLLRLEVLDHRTTAERDVLRRTSILDAVEPALAVALSTGTDTAHLLGALAHSMPFVEPVMTGGGGLRVHPLLRETLLADLVAGDPAEVSELHGVAARALAAIDRNREAARHAVAAGDRALVASALVDEMCVGELLYGSSGWSLLGADLPDDDLFRDDRTPEIAVLAAAHSFAHADTDACLVALLPLLEATAPAGCSEAAASPLRVTAVAVACALALRGLDVAQVRVAVAAAPSLLRALPAATVSQRPELAVLLTAGPGTVAGWEDDMKGADAALRKAVAAAGVSGCARLRVACLEQQSLLQLRRGALGRAAEMASAAVREAKDLDDLGGGGRLARLILAWVAVDHFEVGKAWQHLNATEGQSGAVDGQVEVLRALVRARLLRTRGDLRAALDALSALSGGDRPVRTLWLRSAVWLTQARLLVAFGRAGDGLAAAERASDAGSAHAVVAASAYAALGQPDRARALLSTIRQARSGPTSLRVEAALLGADIAGEAGDARAASAGVARALALAGEESLRREFQEAGPRVRRLLREDAELAAAYRALAPGARSRRSADVRAEVAEEPAPSVVDPLSGRELEVLGHLAAMMRTEEIAATMYVSVNTVRTHVRSILRKLSASRRNEAVRRARELGLI